MSLLDQPLSDARYEDGSDPDRDWCLTIRQPWAELTVMGERWCDDRALPPPADMMGKIIRIHAMGRPVIKRNVHDVAKKAAAYLLGGSFSDAVRDLPRGELVGTVRLTAAFRIGAILVGPLVRSRFRGQHQHLGEWRKFDGRALHGFGSHEQGRWLWCFEDATRCGAGEAIRGYAGLFDLVTARLLRDAPRSPIGGRRPVKEIDRRTSGGAR